MPQESSNVAREVTLPASALIALGRALRTQAGELPGIHSLYEAGFETGGQMYDAFAQELGRPVGDLSQDEFWAELTGFLGKRGWGSLAHDSPHPGVGVLSAPNWAEAGDVEEARPSCSFSSGLLACLLTRAAQGPLAVLEVACRARGDDSCTFAFGSEVAVHDLYGLLLEGVSLDQALSEL